MDPKVVAFIDIGTNSIRLLLVRINPNHSYTTLSEQKETIRLGEGEFADGYLRPEAMQRAVMVCKQFAEMARSNNAEEISAVATAATREARNKRDFLRLLRSETQLDVRTVSGVEEARLIYLGVSSGIHLEEKSALFIDIGGGSTELIVGDQHSYHYLDSLKLGAVRLTALFFTPDETGPVDASRYALIQQYVRNTAIRSIQRLQDQSFKTAYGSSGTIENLADIAVQMFEKRPRTREDVLRFDQLVAVVEQLRSLPLAERARLPGINARRADIIIAGAAILQTTMEALKIEAMHVTDRTLRDGLLVDYLQRSGYEIVQEGSVRRRSVLQLGRKCNFDEPHARKVTELVLSLFDSARETGLHSLGRNKRELLEYAAMLHDVGIFLSYSNHEAHSYYLINNADLLGFDQTEVDAMAAVSYFHRKRYPSKKHAQVAALDGRIMQAVRVMAILLRIAESLDRGHKGAITEARFRPGKKGQAILEVHCERDCQLELWGVQNHEKVFKKAFKRELMVKQKG